MGTMRVAGRTTPTLRDVIRDRAVRILMAALIPLTVLALTSSPAFGHASEVESAPAADQVLDSAPREVRIDFDSGLLEMGSALIVRDADGRSITTGPAVVKDRAFSVPVDPSATPGTYEVAYRVVSADGHTIEGSFAYTVDGGAAAPAQQPVAANESSDGAGLPVIWIVGGGVILILALGAALLWRR